MTRKSIRQQQQRRSDRRQHIFLPHSSWSRVAPPAAPTVLEPEDFWARLGL